MNGLVSILLLFSLPGAQVASQAPRSPIEARVTHVARKGGTWYFAQTGHAVFCYGPVMVVPHPHGGLQKVATFCQGDQTMVPLRD